MEEPKRHVCFCDCTGEILAFADWTEDNDFGYVIVSIYHSWPDSFWTRIKNAWRYYRYGVFAYNEVVISKDKVRDIAVWLNNLQTS